MKEDDKKEKPSGYWANYWKEAHYSVVLEYIPEIDDNESENFKKYREFARQDILITEVNDIVDHDWYLYYPIRESDAMSYGITFKDAELIYLQEFKKKNYKIHAKEYPKPGIVTYLIEN